MLDNTDELAFEVEFLSCVVDKKKDFTVVDADSHFCDFVGVHYSKICQGKLSLLDLLIPQSRQEIVKKLCKKIPLSIIMFTVPHAITAKILFARLPLSMWERARLRAKKSEIRRGR